LDVLLALARQQKVDLRTLSISDLADQYLTFVKAAQQRSFALAADYLVMAAWLAYLKSRLLLPKPERSTSEDAPEELAAALGFRLAKLDAMRRAVEDLQRLPQTGRDVFTRGDPQAVVVRATQSYEADLYALIAAYAGQRSQAGRRAYRPQVRSEAYPLSKARERLALLSRSLTKWTPLTGIAPHAEAAGPSRASCLASTFSASLELVKEGELEARQLEAFAEVYLRAPPARPETAP
jgi:segregation and condensation protein A